MTGHPYRRLALMVGVVVVALGLAVPGSASAATPRYVPLKQTKLIKGQGGADAVAVVASGKRAIVAQGDVYGSHGLVDLDITHSPARVLGVNRNIKISGAAELAIRGNSVAYVADGRHLYTVDVSKPTPRLVNNKTYTTDGLNCLALTPNGRYLYVFDSTVFNNGKLLVFHLGRHGVPTLVAHVNNTAIDGMVVGPKGNGMYTTNPDHHSVQTWNISRPTHPRLSGKAIPTHTSDPSDIVLGHGAAAYVFDQATVRVVKVDLAHRRYVTHRTLSNNDFGGGIAISPNGKRIMVLNGHEGPDFATVYLLDQNLRLGPAFKGLCYPEAVTASSTGPTAGRFYVADDGICSNQSYFTPFALR